MRASIREREAQTCNAFLQFQGIIGDQRTHTWIFIHI